MAVALASTAILGTACMARAATYTFTWVGNTSTVWEDAANWNPGTQTGYPDGTDDYAAFGASATYMPTVARGAGAVFDLNIKGIGFTAGERTLGGPGRIQVGPSGLNSAASLGTNTISANIISATSATSSGKWNIGTNSTVVFTGSVSFNGSRLCTPKTGDGTLVFSGSVSNANDVQGTYADWGFQIKQGRLVLDRSNGYRAVPGNWLHIGDPATVGGDVPGEVVLQRDSQIQSLSKVTLCSDGILNLNDRSDSFGILSLAHGPVASGYMGAPGLGGGTVTTGSGMLTLSNGSPINYSGLAVSNSTVATVSGRIHLSKSGTKAISVGSSTSPVCLAIPAVVSAHTTGDLVFQGNSAGVTELSGANIFENPVRLAAGTLLVSGGGNIGTTTATADSVTVSAGATLGGGGGFVYGHVTIQTNAFVSPGSVDAGGSTIGTLTVGDAAQAANM